MEKTTKSTIHRVINFFPAVKIFMNTYESKIFNLVLSGALIEKLILPKTHSLVILCVFEYGQVR